MKLFMLILGIALTTDATKKKTALRINELRNKITGKLLADDFIVGMLPSFNESERNIIAVNIFIDSIRSITSEATADIYLRHLWYEPAIALQENNFVDPTSKASINFNRTYVKMDSTDSNVKRLWKPDTFFSQIRDVKTMGTMEYMRVGDDGLILTSKQLKVVMPCTIRVSYFPFDVTFCTVTLSSYGHPVDDLVYKWRTPAIILPSENLDDIGFSFMHITAKSTVDKLDTGDFSTIVADIFFQRNFNVYIIQVYIPAALIVMLSWLGFWINRNATPARASIGITTVLTMLTLASQTMMKYDENISSSVNALDLYVWGCFTFVIMAMVEFACADYFNKPKFSASKQTSPTKKANPASVSLLSNEADNGMQSAGSGIQKFRALVNLQKERSITPPSASRVDQISRYLFPLVFLIFNVIYITSYSILSYILYNSIRVD